MRTYRTGLTLLVLWIAFYTAQAQTNTFCQANANTLYCKIPSLFGNAIVNPLQSLDQAIATQLTLVPLASPASGIVYTKDAATKLPVPSRTETFGPVLSERGETLYMKKLFVAATFQRFRFDSLDSFDLKHVPFLFEFCSTQGQCGPIAAVIRVDAHVEQYAFFATYGVNSWLDTSIAVPLNRVSLAASGVSCVQPYCSFTTPGGTIVSFQTQRTSGSAIGIGDVLLRGKATIVKWGKVRVAEGADIRLPSGDSLNFLGTGSVGVKPFLAASIGGRFSPHFNASYQWNGSSFLGAAVAGQKGSLPRNFAYVAGADFGATRQLTVSADFLGEHVVNASRLQQGSVLGIPNAVTTTGSFNTARGAFGFKWKPAGDYLASGNVLIKFDRNGLHEPPVIMFGISRTFGLYHSY